MDCAPPSMAALLTFILKNGINVIDLYLILFYDGLNIYCKLESCAYGAVDRIFCI